MKTTLYIKGMVCVRCKMAVESVLEEAQVPYGNVQLGWAIIHAELTAELKNRLEQGLNKYRLQLLENKTSILVERIKTEIIQLFQLSQPQPLKLSVHLSHLLGYNYTYLANTFSDQEGITLERYFISQRVERVKELIIYEELPLNEITDILAFSSVSHLCAQFKKVSGLTPAEFRKRSREKNFIWREIN